MKVYDNVTKNALMSHIFALDDMLLHDDEIGTVVYFGSIHINPPGAINTHKHTGSK